MSMSEVQSTIDYLCEKFGLGDIAGSYQDFVKSFSTFQIHRYKITAAISAIIIIASILIIYFSCKIIGNELVTGILIIFSIMALLVSIIFFISSIYELLMWRLYPSMRTIEYIIQYL